MAAPEKNRAKSKKVCVSFPIQTPEQTLITPLNVSADFRKAFDHCQLFPSEQKINRFFCLIFYAVYLSEHEPSRKQDIDRLIQDALCVLSNEGNEADRQNICKHIPGQWFNLAGDHEADHAKALFPYRLGIEVGVKWVEVWVKGLAAAFLAGLPDEVAFIRNRLTDDDAATLLSVLAFKAIHRRQLFHPLSQVCERWKTGLRLFDEFWGINQKIRYVLEGLSAKSPRMLAKGPSGDDRFEA